MSLKQSLETLLYTSGTEMSIDRFIFIASIYCVGFSLAAALVFLHVSLVSSILAFIAVLVLLLVAIYILLQLSANKRIQRIEDLLPDFLTLMSSNLRSGLTPDHALIVSARKEFGPLANEITKASKLVVSGKAFDEAFSTIGSGIGSIALSKAIRLVVEGIRAGGNLADLLDSTAADVRRFNAIKAEVGSNVLVYRLFLFAAAAFSAPLLYATATFLISIVANVRGLVAIDTTAVEAAGFGGLPLLKSTTALSPELVFYFSLAALVLTAFFSSLAAGVVSAGRASEGTKYFPIILIISLGVFIGTRILLETVFSTLFLVSPT